MTDYKIKTRNPANNGWINILDAQHVYFTPTGDIISDNVQDAINEVDAKASGGLDWSVFTELDTGTELSLNGKYMCVAASPFSLVLPTPTLIGNVITVHDAAGNTSLNNITLENNGTNINGILDDLVINIDNATVELVYVDATIGWKVL